jgi:GDP-4-dehydro-6-deoxy-D-mannose reductase
MKAFVTGLTGFVGPHLARMLVGKGYEVDGLGFCMEKPRRGQSLPSGVSVANADIRDYPGVLQVLKESQPTHIFHLAAISNVAISFANPRLTYEVNVGGTLNLLEALRELKLKPQIVHVSSAHVYRSIQAEEGLTEDSPVHLQSPYAASKFMCESLISQYVESYGFHAMIVRPFNHIGPGQLTGFVCSDFARQIAAIRLGQAEPVMHVGNLAPIRDFTDVRDTVEAYWTVATQGVSGEIYNVSSNRAISIQKVVLMLCKLANVEVSIIVDEERIRPIESLRLFGNSSKIRALGWKPRIEFEQTLKDILEYWLSVLA